MHGRHIGVAGAAERAASPVASSTAMHGLGHGQLHSASTSRHSGQLPFKIVTPTMSSQARWSRRLGGSPYSVYSQKGTPASRLSAQTATSEEDGPVTPDDNPYDRLPVKRKPVPTLQTPGSASFGLGIASPTYYQDSSERRGGFVESLGLAPILVSPARPHGTTKAETPRSQPFQPTRAPTAAAAPIPGPSSSSAWQDKRSHFSMSSAHIPPASNVALAPPPALLRSSPSTHSDLMSLTSVEPTFHETAHGGCEAFTFPHPRVLQASPPRISDLPRLRRQRDADESSVRRVLRETDELNHERESWQRRQPKQRRKKSLDLLRTIFEREAPPKERPLRLPPPRLLKRTTSSENVRASVVQTENGKENGKPARPPPLRQRSASLDSIHLRPVLTDEQRHPFVAAFDDSSPPSTKTAARAMQVDQEDWKEALRASLTQAPVLTQRPAMPLKQSSNESRDTSLDASLGPSPDFDQLFFKLPTTSAAPVVLKNDSHFPPSLSSTSQDDEEILPGFRYRNVATPSHAFQNENVENSGIRSEHATPEQTLRSYRIPREVVEQAEPEQESLSASIASRLARINDSKISHALTKSESMTSNQWQTATEGTQTPDMSDRERFEEMPLPTPPEQASPHRPFPTPGQSSWAATSYAREYLGSLQDDENTPPDEDRSDSATVERRASTKARRRAEGLSFLEISPLPPVSFLDMSPPMTPLDGSLLPQPSVDFSLAVALGRTNVSTASRPVPPSPARSDRLLGSALPDVRSRTSTGELSSVGSVYDPSIMDGFPQPPSPWSRRRQQADESSSIDKRRPSTTMMIQSYAEEQEAEEGDTTIHAMPSVMTAVNDRDSPSSL